MPERSGRKLLRRTQTDGPEEQYTFSFVIGSFAASLMVAVYLWHQRSSDEAQNE
jgi:hypothetical protein